MSKRISADRYLFLMVSHYQGVFNVAEGVAESWANMLVYLLLKCWSLWFMENLGTFQIGSSLNGVVVAKISPQNMFGVKLDEAWKGHTHCSSIEG